MNTMRLDYPIAVLCRAFEVSRSGFYAWSKGKLSPRAQVDERLKVAIKAVHKQSRETYGTRRVQPELEAQGFIAGRDRIARLRRELNLRCKQKRKFKATTNSNHNLPVADNLLNQTFAPTRPNEAWVTDITYCATDEGWLYVAGIKDVFTCELVGYAMGERMTQGLTAQALWRAVRNKRPEKGLIHHSDRGSQYCAHDYRKLVEQFGMQASMSRKGNCFDNAPMESFWGSLKNELIHHHRYATRADANAAIQEYIESFYNRQRRHSRLGNVAPALFAEAFSKQQQAA
jgi:putative transposase